MAVYNNPRRQVTYGAVRDLPRPVVKRVYPRDYPTVPQCPMQASFRQVSATSTLGLEYTDARSTVRCNLALVVNKLLNFPNNVSNVKQCARKNMIFVVSELQWVHHVQAREGSSERKYVIQEKKSRT